jgi:BCD family chlorophyll transporter-like MFS transporter
MKSLSARLAIGWTRISTRYLPFADAATAELPLARLLRLSLFQVSVGMATVLLIGTLNRVMIVELGVAAWLVSLMVALPLIFAPFRALIGFRSDTHRSVLGWKRVPFIWMGTLIQFGGLAILPFALILLSGDTHGPAWIGHAGAALAFLLVGAGLQTTQTAGLALATDLAPADSRPKVVALMYVMLLAGMVVSGLLFGALLADFSQLRLIKVIQGAAVATMILNVFALWKQEARSPREYSPAEPRPAFRDSWSEFSKNQGATRFLVALGFGTAAFNMQDIILEPYGAQVLELSVSATTTLTALLAAGAMAAFAISARFLARGIDPLRLSAYGTLVGIGAFAAVISAAPLESAMLFRIGAIFIGFGGGLFSVGTLTAAMGLERRDRSGLALGAWGAVQATSAGVAVALGGAIRDAVSGVAAEGLLGSALTDVASGYGVVYLLEIGLLFVTLVAIGPLVGMARDSSPRPVSSRFELAEFHG